MKLTWFGHSGFRIEIGDQVLLVDPWLTGNPMFPQDRRDEAIKGATAILVSHGHGDHASDVPAIALGLKIPAVGTYDLMGWWEKAHGIATVGFNKGGTIRLGNVAVTLVNAVHSSSIAGDAGPIYGGHEAGFMIEGEGRTIYFSGDTDVTADMEVFEALHHPQIGILSRGRALHHGHEAGGLGGQALLQLRDGDPLPLPHLPAARAVGGGDEGGAAGGAGDRGGADGAVRAVSGMEGIPMRGACAAHARRVRMIRGSGRWED